MAGVLALAIGLVAVAAFMAIAKLHFQILSLRVEVDLLRNQVADHEQRLSDAEVITDGIRDHLKTNGYLR